MRKARAENNAHYREIKRKWREKNREKERAQRKKRRADNLGHHLKKEAEWRAKRIEQIRKYSRNRDPQKKRDAAKRYREKHPERAAAAMARWQKNNPDKIRGYNFKRREVIVNAGPFDAEDFKAKCKAQKNKCLYCNYVGTLVPDHITPLKRGGTNAPSNIQALCQPCNSSKGIRTPMQYFSWLNSHGLL
jgi:5-methylcytosine-specific restriction endonuclease McrA